MKIDLSKAMDKLLTEYGTEITEELADAVQDVGNDTVSYLKSTSPRGNGKRHYASGWSAEVEKTWHGTSLIVYNKTKPQLTHLLNDGHHYVSRSGERLFDVAGDQHIDHAETYANDLLIAKVEGALKR